MNMPELAKALATCAIVLIMASGSRAETSQDFFDRVIYAYSSDYGSPSTTPKVWEEREKLNFPEMKDPNSKLHRLVDIEYAKLQKMGSEILKKSEAHYELVVMTAYRIQMLHPLPDDEDDKIVASFPTFNGLFAPNRQPLTADKESKAIITVQAQPVVAPQAGTKVKTLADWITFIKGDAKLSSLLALLGKPDGKDESQDNFQRYTTYRWWAKVDVGTTHAEDLKVITVVAHGQPIIVRIENPSSGEEMDFPWTDATIWARN